ncbi:unnamed protein product [Brassica napus]|uniref:(rape) hypothetical protein n=2 Tax=Brassica napus TaxID=3708 RepID=A0A816J0Y4_BRANA|nr:unnamed protein product [Brassica napus]
MWIVVLSRKVNSFDSEKHLFSSANMAPPTGETTAAGGDAQPQQQRQAGGFGQTITAESFESPSSATSLRSSFRRNRNLRILLSLRLILCPISFRALENDKFNDFGNDGALVWHETNIPYAVWKPASTRTLSMKYYPSEALKNNGSLYAHVFFARSSFPIDPNDPELRLRRRLMGMTWN